MKKLIVAVVVIILTAAGYVLYEYRNFAAVTTGKVIMAGAGETCALLVVDIQNDLTQPDGKAVVNSKMTDAMIPKVNALIRNFEENGNLVVYIRHEYDKPLFNLLLNNMLKAGTPGTEIDKRVEVINENIFVKNRMDAFSNSAFERKLIDNRINSLYVTGIDAKYCVDKAVRAAIQRAYRVTVVSDAIATGTDSLRSVKLEEFRALGATIKSAETVLNEHFIPLKMPQPFEDYDTTAADFAQEEYNP